METQQTLAEVIPIREEVLPEVNQRATAFLNTQRYKLWQLGLLALSSTEAAMLRTGQAVEV